jgi:hypothetical protein
MGEGENKELCGALITQDSSKYFSGGKMTENKDMVEITYCVE